MILFAALHESAFGPKRTFHMSHLMSLSGVKRTWAGAVQMSAFDPKRTFPSPPLYISGISRDVVLWNMSGT